MLKNLAIICISAICISCGSAPAEEKHAYQLSDLYWLEGSWQDTLRPNQWEDWKVNPRGMHGRGMNISETGDTSFFEEISLVQDGKDIFFIADVRGNDYPVKFTATKLEKGHVVFENPQHDFPKVITYQLIEGAHGDHIHSSVADESRSIDFFMARRSGARKE